MAKRSEGYRSPDPGKLKNLGIAPWHFFFLLSGFEPETYWDRMHLFQEAIAHRFVP